MTLHHIPLVENYTSMYVGREEEKMGIILDLVSRFPYLNPL